MGKEDLKDIPPSWEASEKSNSEALKCLVKDAIKYSPREGLKLLKEHPGATTTAILVAAGIISALTGHPVEGVWLYAGGLFVLGVASLAEIGQIPYKMLRHEWRNYKRGLKDPYPDNVYDKRNFL